MHKFRIVQHENDLGHVWYNIEERLFFMWFDLCSGLSDESLSFDSMEDALKTIEEYKQYQENYKKKKRIRKTSIYVDKC